MAIIEEIIGGEVLAGAGLGAGIVLILGRVARPAAKALIRGGIVVYREAADILSEAAASPAAISLRAGPQRMRARPEEGQYTEPCQNGR
jgi:hypothetical protein